MLSLRLFLPESWTGDIARMIKAGAAEEMRQPRTKPEIAIEEIDRIIAAGVRFGCVLADAGYGLSASFRQALTARGLCWAVGIPKHQKVYPADVQLIFPEAARGRPRLRHVPDIKSLAAQAMLEGVKWRKVSWRRGTKGRLVARFAAVRVRIADGAPQRIGSSGAQHMPGEETWLVGEHRSNGERKYYLSNLPADTPIKDLAGAIKARWICEQAHQQLKEEVSLDHFEGRSWTGLHRHALMTMMAYAFLQTRRLAQAGRKKDSSGHRLSPAFRQCARLSLTASRAHRQPAVLTVAAVSPEKKSHFCQSSVRTLSVRGHDKGRDDVGLGRIAQCIDPGDEAVAEQRRRQRVHHVVEPVMRGDAVVERSHPTQEIELASTPAFDLDEILGSSQRRAQNNQKDFIERIEHVHDCRGSSRACSSAASA